MVAYVQSEVVMAEARTSRQKRKALADTNSNFSMGDFLLSAFRSKSETSMRNVCFGK